MLEAGLSRARAEDPPQFLKLDLLANVELDQHED